MHMFATSDGIVAAHHAAVCSSLCGQHRQLNPQWQNPINTFLGALRGEQAFMWYPTSPQEWRRYACGFLEDIISDQDFSLRTHCAVYIRPLRSTTMAASMGRALAAPPGHIECQAHTDCGA